jgi:hypothetical protein
MVLAALVVLVPRVAAADNKTAATAYSLVPGGTPAEASFDPANTERWYWMSAYAGRSYCAETQGGVHFDTAGSANIDTQVDVYQADGVTLIVTNDDSGEPAGRFTSRACWIQGAAGYIKVKVYPFSNTYTFNVRVRIVETTMFSNWFYTGADYSAYTIVRNTTSGSINYTINWRNSAGAIITFVTGALNGNGSMFIDARSVNGIGVGQNGTVEIVHNASAGAIMATTTVLSATTGLSFDTIFVLRPTW